MTPQELKNSILQLAIQGKLVEQRPEEGTAEELLKQIQAEKQALIKAGKIKKEKPLPEITEDEKPFDIPDSWKWVQVGSVAILNPKNDIDDSDDAGFIPMSCVADGYRNQHTFEVKKWGEIKKGFTHFADYDIGIAKITPCFQNRKSVIFHNLPNGYGAGTTELSIVRVLGDTMCREYLLWFFKTDYFISNGVKSFTGTAGQQRIHKDYLANCVFPLPPLAEQMRIVAKIEELLPLIDRYEEAWTKLEAFNKRFPDDMQKSLLQMAIQGKLVEQRPEEGTGEELYTQIQAEKQTLIKSGKIKKDKPLPEITDDEKPFDIPESWKWVRWGEIVNIVSARRVHQSDWKSDGIPFYRAREIAKLAENGCVENELFISQDLFDEFSKSGVPQAGDLMVTAVGTLGKTYIVKSEDHFYYKDASVICFENFAGMLPEYLKYVMQSEMMKNQIKSNSDGTTVATLTMVRTVEYVLPLPPLDEQKRIVAKLEELLPLCEGLK